MKKVILEMTWKIECPDNASMIEVVSKVLNYQELENAKPTIMTIREEK